MYKGREKKNINEINNKKENTQDTKQQTIISEQNQILCLL